MCLCVSVNEHACIMCTYIKCLGILLPMSACLYVHMSKQLGMCICVYVFVRVCMCVSHMCVCVCVFVCVDICLSMVHVTRVQ